MVSQCKDITFSDVSSAGSCRMFIDYTSGKDAARALDIMASFLSDHFASREIKPLACIKVCIDRPYHFYGPPSLEDFAGPCHFSIFNSVRLHSRLSKMIDTARSSRKSKYQSCLEVLPTVGKTSRQDCNWEKMQYVHLPQYAQEFCLLLRCVNKLCYGMKTDSKKRANSCAPFHSDAWKGSRRSEFSTLAMASYNLCNRAAMDVKTKARLAKKRKDTKDSRLLVSFPASHIALSCLALLMMLCFHIVLNALLSFFVFKEKCANAEL